MKKLPLKTAVMGACAAAMGWLAACAVGPNFKPPEAPRNAGFAPAGQTRPEGQAQRYVDGMDIPGQWWTLFQSAPLNALIERALANSPTLQAAQAALRQAEQTTHRHRGRDHPRRCGKPGEP